MRKENNLGEAERDLNGGLVGAAVVLICVAPFIFLKHAHLAFTFCGLLILLGCASGSIGAKSAHPLRALLLGVLPFTMVFFFYLPFLASGLWVTQWWGDNPRLDKSALDGLALLIAASALGGLCGFAGSVVGRMVPRSTEKQRLQFTIQEGLWIFLLIALYLGPSVYFLRQRLPK